MDEMDKLAEFLGELELKKSGYSANRSRQAGQAALKMGGHAGAMSVKGRRGTTRFSGRKTGKATGAKPHGTKLPSKNAAKKARIKRLKRINKARARMGSVMAMRRLR